MKIEDNGITAVDSANVNIAGVVHDFKAIINQVGGLTSLLKIRLEQMPDKEIHKIIGYIEQAYTQGLAISNDFMKVLALEEASFIPLEVQLLNPVIEQQINLYKELAKTKEVNVEYEIAAKKFFFELNKSKFIRILDNLFANALKAVSRNGTIKITLSEQGGSAIIAVHDSGQGMSEALQNDIFKKYSIAKQYNTASSAQSPGLGLYITKKLVELHNGSIYFTSNESGTSFFVKLNRGLIL